MVKDVFGFFLVAIPGCPMVKLALGTAREFQQFLPELLKEVEDTGDSGLLFVLGVTKGRAVSPIFKFSTTVRKVIYTTNAIESLNSIYRKLNRQRSVFPSDTALLKALYLATFEATKKWTTTIRDWAQVYGELSIMYEGRLPE